MTFSNQTRRTTSKYDGLGLDNRLHLGLEFESMHGLHLYDNNARQRDPLLNLFTSIDPLCEKYPWISTYAVCANNPLKYADYNGMDWIEDKDGNVEWRKDVTSDNVSEGYKYIGTEYNGVTVLQFNILISFSSNPCLEFKLGYQSHVSEDQKSYNWIQTVERDNNGNKLVDYDSKSKEGIENYPFYQDKYENKFSQNTDGFDIIFYDRPNETSRNGDFSAELSLMKESLINFSQNKIWNLVTNKSGKIYTPILTLSWGFTVKNGHMVTHPIKVVTPSTYQLQTIKQIK